MVLRMAFDKSSKLIRHIDGKSNFHALITSHVFNGTTTFINIPKAYCFNHLPFRIAVIKTLFVQCVQKIGLNPKGLFKYFHCFNSVFTYIVPSQVKVYFTTIFFTSQTFCPILATISIKFYLCCYFYLYFFISFCSFFYENILGY